MLPFKSTGNYCLHGHRHYVNNSHSERGHANMQHFSHYQSLPLRNSHLLNNNRDPSNTRWVSDNKYNFIPHSLFLFDLRSVDVY